MISDGFKLLVVGMGYVLIFLSIMVIIIELVAKGIKPFAHLVEEKAAAAPRKAPQKTGGKDNKNLIAAAIAAVHMHRSKK
jgi:oxaloacetate decarboxylase gamma subunit